MRTNKKIIVLLIGYMGLVIVFESSLGLIQPRSGDTMVITSFEIDGKAINHFHSLNNVNIGAPHDVLVFLTDEILSAGNTVTSAISITWSGSNAFDPSAISSLLLTWGYDGISESYPYGDPQGTTSTPAVPDTGSTAALLGAGVFVLAAVRRRLG